MNSQEHFLAYLDRVAKHIRLVRFLSNFIGVGLSAVGYFLRDSSYFWLSYYADTFWLVGLALLLLANFLLVFLDKQSIETLRKFHTTETELEEVLDEREDLLGELEIWYSWNTLTKLLSELTDQAIEANTINKDQEKRLYNAAVEFIADYKSRIFGFEDDYANISAYQFNSETELLECVACFRTRPSDAQGQRRSWRIGEGHVGKAFELQKELVCSDARVPDVAQWIEAPPNKLKEEDRDLYVSLAAVPLAIRKTAPQGVLIMTSSVAGRFINANETESDVELQRAKLSVAALQDIAAQIAQLMYIIHTKKVVKEDE